MATTPWQEYVRLAEDQSKPLYGKGESRPYGADGKWDEYVDLATTRDYTGDPALIDDPRAFLESQGAKMVPHSGELVWSESEELYTSGAFWHHLTGNEEVLREWQRADGEELYPDTICLSGLYHSIYGTQGFQAFRFPIEQRAQIAAMIGERGELAAYYTCAMERSSFQEMVLANAGLKPGETPVGTFNGRRNCKMVMLSRFVARLSVSLHASPSQTPAFGHTPATGR